MGLRKENDFLWLVILLREEGSPDANTFIYAIWPMSIGIIWGYILIGPLVEYVLELHFWFLSLWIYQVFSFSSLILSFAMLWNCEELLSQCNYLILWWHLKIMFSIQFWRQDNLLVDASVGDGCHLQVHCPCCLKQRAGVLGGYGNFFYVVCIITLMDFKRLFGTFSEGGNISLTPYPPEEKKKKLCEWNL